MDGKASPGGDVRFGGRNVEVEVPGGEEKRGALGLGDGCDGLLGGSLDGRSGGLELALLFASLKEHFTLGRGWESLLRTCLRFGSGGVVGRGRRGSRFLRGGESGGEEGGKESETDHLEAAEALWFLSWLCCMGWHLLDG
jgi:hypothetical protein